MTYGFADSQFSVLGTSLVVVNTVVVVLETLSKRHLMTNQTNPLQLTRQAITLALTRTRTLSLTLTLALALALT